MGKQALKYTGALIALYVVVANGSGFGRAFLDGANGTSTVIKTLQARP